jgi:hypothetical protein
MATRTIYVSRNGTSYNLKLSDSEGHNPGNDNLTTDVDPGDTVQWVLDSNSGLSSLNGVNQSVPGDPSYDTNSINLLTGAPQSNGNGGYTGTVVSSSPGAGRYEKYKIYFQVPGDPSVYNDDPKLQMNG